jgi:hypothetical protein
MKDGLTEFFADWDEPFGPWESINEMIEARFAERRVGQRWYKSNGVKEGDDGLIEYDRMGSGEATTSVSNGEANAGQQRRNLDELASMKWRVHGTEYSFLSIMELLRMQIMGDDEQETWRDMMNVWNLSLHKTFVDTAVNVAARNGYDLNPFKTLVRKSAAEFLKKYALFGHIVPLGLTQLYGKERGGLKVDPLAKNADYATLVGVLSARGFNKTNADARVSVEIGKRINKEAGLEYTPPVIAEGSDLLGYAMKVRDYTWCLTRGLRFFEKSDAGDVKGFVYLPAGLLYTPRVMRGIGAHWHCPYGTNRDAAIAVWCSLDRKFEKLVEDSSGVVASWKSELDLAVRRQIRSSLRDGTCDPNLKQAMKTVQSTMPKSRMISSIEASKIMDSMGMAKLGGRHYLQYPGEMTSLMLTRNAKLDRIKLIDQLSKTRNIRQGITTNVSVRDKFPWVYAFDWEIVKMEDTTIVGCEPIVGLDMRSQRVMHRLGIDFSKTHARITGADILDKIRQDEFARRDLTEEQYYDELTKPEVLATPQMIPVKLMAMGVRPDIAAAIGAQFTSNRDSVGLKLNVTPVSFGDELLSNLDSSLERIEQSVSCDLLDDENVKIISLNTGYMVYVQALYGNGDCIVRCKTRIDSMGIIKRALGRFEDAQFHDIEALMARRWE